MDGFAISFGSGLSVPDRSLGRLVQTGTIFAATQTLMLVVGWWLGHILHSTVAGYEHWIACAILVAIGARMIKGTFLPNKRSAEEIVQLGPSQMLALALATSVDAFAVGASLGVLRTNIVPAAVIVALITFSVAVLGSYVGSAFGRTHKLWGRWIGGGVLIAVGVRVLSYHIP